MKISLFKSSRVSMRDAERVARKLGVSFGDFTLDAFHRGMTVELEHQDVTHGDLVATAKIALAHLGEDPRYYEKLERMEKSVVAAHTRVVNGKVVPVQQYTDRRTKKTPEAPPPAKMVSAKVWRTDFPNGRYDDFFCQRGAGFYVALDAPWEQPGGVVRRMTVKYNPERIFDPHACVKGTPFEKARAEFRAITDRMNAIAKKETKAGGEKTEFPQLRTRVLKEFGYEGEAGYIEGPSSPAGRELVLFDHGTPPLRKSLIALFKSRVRAHQSHTKAGVPYQVEDYDNKVVKKPTPAAKPKPKKVASPEEVSAASSAAMQEAGVKKKAAPKTLKYADILESVLASQKLTGSLAVLAERHRPVEYDIPLDRGVYKCWLLPDGRITESFKSGHHIDSARAVLWDISKTGEKLVPIGELNPIYRMMRQTGAVRFGFRYGSLYASILKGHLTGAQIDTIKRAAREAEESGIPFVWNIASVRTGDEIATGDGLASFGRSTSLAKSLTGRLVALFKSRVKAHQSHTKTGVPYQVQEYTNKVQKKPEPSPALTHVAVGAVVDRAEAQFRAEESPLMFRAFRDAEQALGRVGFVAEVLRHARERPYPLGVDMVEDYLHTVGWYPPKEPTPPPKRRAPAKKAAKPPVGRVIHSPRVTYHTATYSDDCEFEGTKALGVSVTDIGDAMVAGMPSSWTVKADVVWIDFDMDNSYNVSVSMVGHDGDPRDPGEPAFRRTLTVKRMGGEVEIHRDWFSIRHDLRGHGVSKESDKAIVKLAEQAATATGLSTHITMDANLDVGGYAWARAGYDFDRQSQRNAVARAMIEFAKSVVAAGDYPHQPNDPKSVGDEWLEGVTREIKFLAASKAPASEFAEMGRDWGWDFESEIGMEKGKTGMWHFGKAAMLGTSWEGVLKVPPPKNGGAK